MPNFLKRFHEEEGGSLSVEAAIIAPMLLWAYLATFVYFDSYRAQATATKASYTLSDMLSRELGYINNTYLDNLESLFNFLTNSQNPTRLRLTMVRYDAVNDEYKVNWSKNRGATGNLSDANINNYRAALPVMPHNEVVIVFETWRHYNPEVNVGFDPFVIENFIVTRPRFAPQLCWVSDSTC
jgi:hypothetical protein